MLDSPQLRRDVVSAINGAYRLLYYPFRTVRNLKFREQVMFFQFYLTKGLIYEGYVSVESEALFWLLQNVSHDFIDGYHLIDKGRGGVISMWLMSIVPSNDHIFFMFEPIGVEEQEILSRYDNVNRVGFSSEFSRQMGWN
jgi:hypothetical protein